MERENTTRLRSSQGFTPLRYDRSCLLAAMLLFATTALAADPVQQFVATFDGDPRWEGFRNRLSPERPREVRQDFGYRTSQLAGGQRAGEIGGVVQRSSAPAYYALAIEPKSFEDPLHASGSLAVPSAGGGSGVMLGWFGAPPPSWRTPNSLAFRLDGNGGKFWTFYEYGTSQWRTGGGGAFEGERYQTTPTLPFPADGKPHRWSLDFDPSGDDGRGVLTFQIDDRKYQLSMAAGHRQDGARLDHFGIWNVQTPGDPLEIYLDDLEIDGRRFGFDDDPKWDAEGNQATYVERFIRPYHDFGYSATNHAGGTAGEIGGVVFRDEKPSYYAAPAGALSLDDELIASGRLSLHRAASDSGVYLGWFNAAAKQAKLTPDHEVRQNNHLGALIEGPSRTGHYFRPAYGCSAGRGQIAGETAAAGNAWPIVYPDATQHTWAIHYRPRAADGKGQIEITFDEQRETLDLKPGDRAEGAKFDRFGIFNIQSGGHAVEFYLDDVKYTRR